MPTFESTERYSEEISRLRRQIEQRAGKSCEELSEEREQRVRDAIQLKEPDRVPVVVGGGLFAARYAGLNASSMYYDYTDYRRASIKMLFDLDPDLCRPATPPYSGRALELLDARHMRIPGFNLPPDVGYQFVEGEYMKPNEYDLFLSDPSDYILRYHLPRLYGALEPLAKLPPIKNLSGTALTGITPLFATPEFRQVAEILSRVGEEEEKRREAAREGDDEVMASIGCPVMFHTGGILQAPFDVVSDFFRGMRGSMTDMYRNPDKLLAACDKVLEWRIAEAVQSDPSKTGNPKRAFMPLHRGAEGFMSIKQFEKFYWPGLKKAILANIDLGYVPVPFIEGRFESRLEYLLELPKHSIVAYFEHTDMIRAKEVLGDHLCIMGNVPSPLLQVGAVHEVEEYCQKLIKVCGKGGGFILTNGSSIDEAKPANIKAMIDSVKKYGAR